MKSRLALFYVEIFGGNCLLVEARGIEAARRYVLGEYGRNAAPRVKKATPDNEAWVKAMGGAVHQA
jgi:hypothetical protein